MTEPFLLLNTPVLVDIGQFIIRLHEWLVATVCEVEGDIKKVDDVFVSFDCDFKAIRFEHLAAFLLGFFNFFWGGLANCEAIVTVQTNFGSYTPFMKPNNKLSYVHQQSNHPPALLKNIPLNINKTLTSISSSKEVFDESIALYQKALTESGYDHKLTYNPPQEKALKTKENEQETSHGTTLLSTQTSELTLEENFCTSSTNAFQKTTHSTRFSTDTR